MGHGLPSDGEARKLCILGAVGKGGGLGGTLGVGEKDTDQRSLLVGSEELVSPCTPKS